MNPQKLNSLAVKAKKLALFLNNKSESGHIGGVLSSIDILVAIYFGQTAKFSKSSIEDSKSDTLLFSKGHAVLALYVVLYLKGMYSKKELETFCQNGSRFQEQPLANKLPGIEWATGSLGHGLNVAVGIALANRSLKLPHKVFVVLSDGDCQEGSTWEAILFAGQHKLGNLVCLVDANLWQATDKVENVLSNKNIHLQTELFGWQSFEVEITSPDDLNNVLQKLDFSINKPKFIVCRTRKGKGVSFMEGDNNWHYKSIDDSDLILAMKELEL